MSNLFALGLGCFSLGLVIAYMIWSKVRAAILRANLQMIEIDLDSCMRAKGTTNDSHYLALRSFIQMAIENAPYFSIPTLWIYLRLRRGSRKPSNPSEKMTFVSLVDTIADFIKAEGSPDEVKTATTRVIARLVLHFAFTPSAMMLWIMLSIFGRTGKIARSLSVLRHDSRDFEVLVSYLR